MNGKTDNLICNKYPITGSRSTEELVDVKVDIQAVIFSGRWDQI